MQPEDRLIHFSTELLHKPVQHKVPALQKLYYELSQDRRVSYDSSDFSMPPQYRFYSRRGKAQSVAVFLPDRVALVEEWADMPLTDFLERVREMLPRVLTGLGIPAFVTQTATLRSTFALTHFRDARVFLMDHVCEQKDRIGQYFGRPIAVGGLRFVLPETPDNRGTLHVTIESFRHSMGEVFVEVKGVFGKLHIDTENVAQAVEHIALAREFIRGHVYPYLDQYDYAQEAPSAEDDTP